MVEINNEFGTPNIDFDLEADEKVQNVTLTAGTTSRFTFSLPDHDVPVALSSQVLPATDSEQTSIVSNVDYDGANNSADVVVSNTAGSDITADVSLVFAVADK